MRETPYTDPFWDALADGDFSIHRCDTCDSRFFPPAPICPHCQSTDVEWEVSSGAGTLFSFTRQHVSASGFDDGIVAGVLELDEGPRLLAPIDEPFDELEIGDRLSVEPVAYSGKFDRGRLDPFPFFVASRIDD